MQRHGHRDVDLAEYEGDPDLLDPAEVLGHLKRAFRVFPRFAREILTWMERLETGRT